MTGFINFNFYLLTCAGLWLVSLALYARITPYPEFKLVEQGNTAAAVSLSGTAIGLALPLMSLATHSVSLIDLVMWAVVALAYQLAFWWLMSVTFLKTIKTAIPAGNTAMGLVLGAFSAGLGLLNYGALTY